MEVDTVPADAGDPLNPQHESYNEESNGVSKSEKQTRTRLSDQEKSQLLEDERVKLLDQKNLPQNEKRQIMDQLKVWNYILTEVFIFIRTLYESTTYQSKPWFLEFFRNFFESLDDYVVFGISYITNAQLNIFQPDAANALYQRLTFAIKNGTGQNA